MISCVAGINVAPDGYNPEQVVIAPNFPTALTYAEGFYNHTKGKIFVRWERKAKEIYLQMEIPKGIEYSIKWLKGIVALSRDVEERNGNRRIVIALKSINNYLLKN